MSLGPLSIREKKEQETQLRRVYFMTMLLKDAFPKQKGRHEDFPGGPVVRAVDAEGMGSIPGQGTKIPHAMRHGQKIFFLKETVREKVKLSRATSPLSNWCVSKSNSSSIFCEK